MERPDKKYPFIRFMQFVCCSANLIRIQTGAKRSFSNIQLLHFMLLYQKADPSRMDGLCFSAVQNRKPALQITQKL